MLFDLVATLFGGVTALLPIYARDILDIGPWGAGMLRSAPAFGALLTAAVLTQIPIRRGAGNLMFAGFALYGVAVIVFGLSTNVALSVISLMLIGTGDMLSSVIRNTLRAGDDAGRDARARRGGEFVLHRLLGPARLVSAPA